MTSRREQQAAGPVSSLGRRHALTRVLAAALLALLGLGATCNGFSKAISKRDARFDEAVRLRGIALASMEEDRYDLAVEPLEQLAEILPDNVLPPINLAICYLRLNRRDEALQQLARARLLDPDNPRTYYTLARVLQEDVDSRAEWREVIREFAAVHPHDPRPYYLQAEAFARDRQFGRAIPLLRRALEEAQENVVLLSDLLVAAAAESDIETANDALNALEDRLDGFDGSLASFATELRQAIFLEAAEEMRPPALIVRNLLRPTELYQVHLAPLVGGRQLGGNMFPQLDFDPPLPKSVQGGQDIDIAFIDATGSLPAGAAETTPWAAVATETDTERILASGDEGIVLWHATELSRGHADLAPGGHRAMLLLAIDADALPDLLSLGSDNRLELFAGTETGGFAVPVTIWDGESEPVAAVWPLDLDHDGDLDLLLTRDEHADLYLQNNGDGSWSERSAELGVGGGKTPTTGIGIADFDEDGDLDLLAVSPDDEARLLVNRRAGAYPDEAHEWGLTGAGAAASAVLTADFDNNGTYDLLLWGPEGATLFGNTGRSFEPVTLDEAAAVPWAAAVVADFDNDGDQDVVAIRQSDAEAILLRNRNGLLQTERLGLAAASAERLLAADLDRDGDLDIVVGLGRGGARYWRNDGGNRNHWLRMVLKGRYDNNSKNNVQGLFCRIESRAGGAFQTILGNGGVNHLGLGARRQAEVLRVVWTNGIAQLWQLVSSDRTLVEEQMLKGSCPFLYTWNGESFEFVTDLMWKSPLGMTLANGRPAPHQSARDFVLIRGESLRPAGRDLWLQVTEELWETVYLDRQRLIAVDHPADVELVVDESFRPPPYPAQAPVHWIERTLEPQAAVDHAGRDILDQVGTRDGRHVADLPLTRYQGLTEGHSMTLSFAGVPADERLRLVLNGWIFPTDTSINVALAQNRTLTSQGPKLELRTADGTWQELSAFIGFPNGKRKAVVVELTGQIPPGDVTLRLSTTLQIYWDSAALAVGDSDFQPLVTALDPAAADLHYRGYSRLYRNSSTGPHLFDYSDVTQEARFRDMRGLYTRYGDVAELLDEEDDRYAVMNAGDELTVRYDASPLPPIPDGWRRDWILYTDGWVKDADINTAFSQTVEPLPFHGQDGYPSQTGGYPTTVEHRRFLQSYQTRSVDDSPFKNRLER